MRQGFSLVELSIVLVILGLLVGGILTGQSLIRASELRAVTTEFGNYGTAMMSFRDKYMNLPGDIDNATNFWGAATVANGDGDRQIEEASGGAAAGEMFGFWQQLALAGMIEGTYTGLSGSDADDADVGINVPQSRIGTAGWSVVYLGTVATSSTDHYEGKYDNAMFFGGETAGEVTQGAVLTPEEAWNIDTKMDDGKPAMGSVKALESQGDATAGAGCGNAAAATTSLGSSTEYDLTHTDKVCSLVFSNR